MKKLFAPLIIPPTLLISLFGPVAAAATEEEQLISIARRLKPISDMQWNEIASSHIRDTYEVQKGDNLWNISKSLFGNPFYWPKVWTLNNSSIGNPHIIEPSQKLIFSRGSSESIPSLSTGAGEPTIEGAKKSTTAAVEEEQRKALDHEYDKLSPEAYAPEDLAVGSDFDDAGIDRDLKIEFENKFSFRVPALVNDTTIPALGEIVGSRREGSNMGEHDVVFVKSNGQDLQVGSYYTIFTEVQKVHAPKSDRSGYSYTAVAEARIIGVKDELYVAEITKCADVVRRSDKIYPLLPLISELKPTPARAAVESLVVFDPVHHGTNSSQFRYVYFDRGIEDGVEVGNVFRIYDYYDPVTGKKITDSDFLVSADVIVIHATAQFSTALILRARETITQGQFGVLLTDVSDLIKGKKRVTKGLGEGTERTGDRELDELDELDRTSGEGLGRKEEQEIKELDQWDKTKDLEPTVPSDTKTPTDDFGNPPSEGAPQEPTAEPLQPLPEGEMAPGPDGSTPLDGTSQQPPLETPTSPSDSVLDSGALPPLEAEPPPGDSGPLDAPSQ